MEFCFRRIQILARKQNSVHVEGFSFSGLYAFIFCIEAHRCTNCSSRETIAEFTMCICVGLDSDVITVDRRCTYSIPLYGEIFSSTFLFDVRYFELNTRVA